MATVTLASRILTTGVCINAYDTACGGRGESCCSLHLLCDYVFGISRQGNGDHQAFGAEQAMRVQRVL